MMCDKAIRYIKFPCLCISLFCSVEESINHQTSSLSPSSGRFIMKISDSATASSHHHQSLGLGDNLHPEIEKMGYSPCICNLKPDRTASVRSVYRRIVTYQARDERNYDKATCLSFSKDQKGSSEDRRRSGRKKLEGREI